MTPWYAIALGPLTPAVGTRRCPRARMHAAREAGQWSARIKTATGNLRE